MRRLLLLVLAIVSFVFAGSGTALAAQGVAVLGTTGARDDAFALARAVYVTPLRPRGLDEVKARLLGGDPPTDAATKDLKDFADLRAAVTSEDAASRQILAAIAKQIDVQAILVVSKAGGVASAADADAGAPEPGTRAQARLFVVEQSEFDAARYDFDGSWEATVRSVSARFPQKTPARPAPAPANPIVVAAPQLPPLGQIPEKKDDRPFYKSPWLWGGLGAALLLGGIFFFASQDKSDDPIHVRMSVPR